MNAETKAIFRQTILCQLEKASEMGLTVKTIAQGCRMAGCESDTDIIEAELAGFLTREGFVKCKADAMSAALSRWQLTGAGRAYLQSQGLA